MPTLAALGFCVVVGFVIAFQLALAAGAPWGAYAMGGRFPGRLPTGLRIAATVQALLLGGLAAVVLVRAGLLPGPTPIHRLVWVVVGFSAVALVLNVITPSARERRLWAPVTLLMLATSLVVAIGA